MFATRTSLWVPMKVASILVTIILTISENSIEAPSGDDKSGHETAQASTRIMKELMEIYKSDSYKKGLFQVEPVDDNLYEWNVKLFFNTDTSRIQEDLQRLRQFGGQDHVMLRVSFNGNYPAEPPFVRVIYPTMMQIGVSNNGSVCMYELSRQGWVSEFTMEGMLLMIMDSFESTNRVDFTRGQQEYTEESARETYKEDMKWHGWDTGRPENLSWYEKI